MFLIPAYFPFSARKELSELRTKTKGSLVFDGNKILARELNQINNLRNFEVLVKTKRRKNAKLEIIIAFLLEWYRLFLLFTFSQTEISLSKFPSCDWDSKFNGYYFLNVRVAVDNYIMFFPVGFGRQYSLVSPTQFMAFFEISFLI